MIQRVTGEGPDIEPVDLEEDVKPHLRIATDEDDELLDALMTAARQACEEYTHTSFYTQTWDLILDTAPGIIELPRPPLATVTGVYVTDDDGVETTVTATTYRVDTVSTPGRVILKLGYSWPDYTDTAGFRIRYIAGIDDTDLIPRALKQAILMLVSYFYQNRGDTRGTVTFAGQQGQLPDDIKVILDQYKVYI